MYDKFYLKIFIINITCLNLLVINVPILEKFSFNTTDFEPYSPKERMCMCICEEIELSFKTSSKYWLDSVNNGTIKNIVTRIFYCFSCYCKPS